MGMKPKHRGEYLTAAEVNELRQAAKHLKRIRTAGGLLTRGGSRGVSISQIPRRPVLDMGSMIKNTEGTDSPTYSILQVTGILDGLLLEGTQVDNERTAMVAITSLQIDTGTVGPCITEGIAYLEVTVGAGESFAVGDRVGPKDGQWTAQVDEGGPCIVLELIDEIPGGGGDVTCIVQLGESYGIPYAYKTTAAPGGGTVTAKRVNSSGVVQGDNITFYTW